MKADAERIKLEVISSLSNTIYDDRKKEHFADCPFCGKPAKKDTHFSFNQVKGNYGSFKCFVCGENGNGYKLAEHLGISVKPEKIQQSRTEYIYTDENGNPTIRVSRIEPGHDGKSKRFIQSKYVNNRWINGTSGVKRYLYRLPEVIAAETVFVVEGEKCADLLKTKLPSSYAVTTNISGGAGKWMAEYSDYLAGKTVYILPDNDTTGKSHAGQVLAHTIKKAKLCKIVNISGLPDKGDIVQYFAAGGTIENLLEICQNTPEPKPEVIPQAMPYFDGMNEFELMEYYLSGKYDFRKNAILGRVEFRKKTETEFVEVTDRDVNNLQIELSKWEPLPHFRPLEKPSRFILNTILDSDYSKLFHPFKEYFENLPKEFENDPIKEFSDCFQVKKGQEEIWIKYLTRWLIATAAQSTGKGTNQTALVLVGEQGIFKTTILNALCPDKQYLYSGAINPEDKDSKILAAEKFIVNLDELESSTRSDISFLKSLFTQDTISVRRPYAKRPETLKRHASFCASINSPDFLSDATGERRWLVVEIENIDKKKFESISIDLVWAKAYQLLLSGEKYWFDKEEIKDINAHNEGFKAPEPEKELLLKQYSPTGLDEKVIWMTNTEILERIQGERKFKLNQIRLGKHLTKQGFQSRKSNGVKLYAVWEKPPAFLQKPEMIRSFQRDFAPEYYESSN